MKPSLSIQMFRTKVGQILAVPFLAVALCVVALTMLFYVPIAMLFGYYPEPVED